MALLDGGLQQMFGAAFGAVLLDGRHYHKTTSTLPNGDASAPVTKVQSIKGYREDTKNRRREEGSGNAMRMLVLQTYEGRVIDRVVRGDVVQLDGLRLVVDDVDEDAAHAGWMLTGAPE